jgi:hypothetical protein
MKPTRNTLTTTHNITYKGHKVVINGTPETNFGPMKLVFSYHIGNRGISYGSKNKYKLSVKLDTLIENIEKDNAYQEKAAAFRALYNTLTPAGKIAHPNFAYARFNPSELGNYYNIYWRSEQSPTGVELVGGCSVPEWEEASKASGNSHNYLSPTEGKRTAH